MPIDTGVGTDGDSVPNTVQGAVHLDVMGYGHIPGDIVVPGGAGTQNAVDFRRIRVRADGTMYKYIDWVCEFDFAFALQNVDPPSPTAPLTGLRSVPTGTGHRPETRHPADHHLSDPQGGPVDDTGLRIRKNSIRI